MTRRGVHGFARASHSSAQYYHASKGVPTRQLPYRRVHRTATLHVTRSRHTCDARHAPLTGRTALPHATPHPRAPRASHAVTVLDKPEGAGVVEVPDVLGEDSLPKEDSAIGGSLWRKAMCQELVPDRVDWCPCAGRDFLRATSTSWLPRLFRSVRRSWTAPRFISHPMLCALEEHTPKVEKRGRPRLSAEAAKPNTIAQRECAAREKLLRRFRDGEALSVEEVAAVPWPRHGGAPPSEAQGEAGSHRGAATPRCGRLGWRGTSVTHL